jgi:membrane associated rhomboid family serine protease
MSPGSGRPIVTWLLIGICVVVFILEIVTGLNPITGGGNSAVENALFYFPGDILARPWTLITVNFTHASFLHIAFNMYSLFVVGPPLERFLGRTRFLALFLISGIGSVIAVDFFLPGGALGASGAIFGLLGTLVIFARRMGIRSAQLYVVIVINLALGYFVPSVAWQAHIGGLIVGVGLGFLLLRTSGPRRKIAQTVGIVAVAVILLIVLLLHALTL